MFENSNFGAKKKTILLLFSQHLEVEEEELCVWSIWMGDEVKLQYLDLIYFYVCVCVCMCTFGFRKEKRIVQYTLGLY